MVYAIPTQDVRRQSASPLAAEVRRRRSYPILRRRPETDPACLDGECVPRCAGAQNPAENAGALTEPENASQSSLCTSVTTRPGFCQGKMLHQYAASGPGTQGDASQVPHTNKCVPPACRDGRATSAQTVARSLSETRGLHRGASSAYTKRTNRLVSRLNADEPCAMTCGGGWRIVVVL